MKQDLLAPPKMSPRTYAKVTGGFTIAAIAAGITYSCFTDRTAPAVALSVLLTLLLTGLSIWSYWALHGRAERSRPERRPLIHAVLSSLIFTTFMGAAGLMFPGFGRMAPWWQLPFMFGLTLAAGGWGRRFGDSMHCPACEYEFNFDNDDAPIRCPECATPWLGRLKRGRRIRSPRLIGIGVALALFGAIILNPIFYMPMIGPSLPTPLLYACLYASPGSVFYCWDELAKRPLSTYWTGVMGERVMSYRTTHQWDRAPSQWLEDAIGAGKVTGALSDRFYAEGFQATLFVPRRVRAGESFEACLRVTQATEAKSALGIMFGGYRVESAAPVGRDNELVWAYQFRPGIFTAHRDAFNHTLRAERSGTVYIHATYWVVYQPSFSGPFTWQPDGTPTMPANANWFQRRDLDEVVRIDP